MTYGHLKPQKAVQSYAPRVFGFKIHKPWCWNGKSSRVFSQIVYHLPSIWKYAFGSLRYYNNVGFLFLYILNSIISKFHRHVKRLFVFNFSGLSFSATWVLFGGVKFFTCHVVSSSIMPLILCSKLPLWLTTFLCLLPLHFAHPHSRSNPLLLDSSRALCVLSCICFIIELNKRKKSN